MGTISIDYNIKHLFKEDKREKIEDKFSCSICSDLIYKKEWYQCYKGHTACYSCWNKILTEENGPKQCPSCSAAVNSLTDGLSRCLTIENDFKNKKIHCPYSYKENFEDKVSKLEQDDEFGCKDLIKVEELEDHQKNCNSRLVKCNNSGCGIISRYQMHIVHENECGFAIIHCQLCDIEILRSELTNHQDSICPSKIITCNQCPTELKRSDFEEHINKECLNSIIPCKFKEYGCNNEFKRSELSSHFEQVNHTIFMLNIIDKQSQQINDLKQENINQSQQLNEFKQTHISTSEFQKQLEEVKETNSNHNIDLEKYINQLNDQFNLDINNFKKQFGEQKERTSKFNTDLIKSIKQQNGKFNIDLKDCKNQLDEVKERDSKFKIDLEECRKQLNELNQRNDEYEIYQEQQFQKQSDQTKERNSQFDTELKECRNQLFNSNQRNDKQLNDLKLKFNSIYNSTIEQYQKQLNEFKEKYNTDLEECRKQLKESNNQCSDLLNKFNGLLNFNNNISYSNTWIITNFKERNGPYGIESPLINVPPYSFKLLTQFKDGYQYYFVFIQSSKEGKVKAKYSFKVLNCIDLNRNSIFVNENEFDLNGIGIGGFSVITEYSKESGYIFPDGSVQVEFTIDIEKQTIQS